MTSYTHDAKRAHLDALRIRQQIAAAEVERAERELAEISDVEQDLHRLRRRKELVNIQLQQARERTTTARVQIALPPIIHGGREGLEAAAREAAGWWTNRKRVA